jgi:hypothetical protein
MRTKAICIVLILALFATGCHRGGNRPLVIGTTAALAVATLLLPQLFPSDARTLFLTTLLTVVLGVLVFHTLLSVPSKVPTLPFTEIAHVGAIRVFYTFAILVTLFQNIAAAQPAGEPVEPAFTEGLGVNGLTIHPNMETAMPEGDYFIVTMNTAGLIPLSSPGNVYQFAFVFDEDGLPENNYTTSDNDFFNDTDRWYEVLYDQASGWTLKVSNASNSAITETSSSARVILSANAMVLVVPRAEFSVPEPSFRVTAFCHTGDFGFPEPHNWSGDLEPPVAQGLMPFPAQPE